MVPGGDGSSFISTKGNTGDGGGKGSEVSFCAGCNQVISDRYYLMAVKKKWHSSCLRCAECQLPLESLHTCYHKDGNIYCRQDYQK